MAFPGSSRDSCSGQQCFPLGPGAENHECSIRSWNMIVFWLNKCQEWVSTVRCWIPFFLRSLLWTNLPLLGWGTSPSLMLNISLLLIRKHDWYFRWSDFNWFQRSRKKHEKYDDQKPKTSLAMWTHLGHICPRQWDALEAPAGASPPTHRVPARGVRTEFFDSSVLVVSGS